MQGMAFRAFQAVARRMERRECPVFCRIILIRITLPLLGQMLVLNAVVAERRATSVEHST